MIYLRATDDSTPILLIIPTDDSTDESTPILLPFW